MGQVEK